MLISAGFLMEPKVPWHASRHALVAWRCRLFIDQVLMVCSPTSMFGNLADIGKALRAARKARREDMEQQAEALQSPMFDL
jgi:hypothetical protein